MDVWHFNAKLPKELYSALVREAHRRTLAAERHVPIAAIVREALVSHLGLSPDLAADQKPGRPRLRMRAAPATPASQHCNAEFEP
ncbi:MAG: hypothetical protein WCH83_06660 [Alphaproteobacteria bacterium]